MGVCSKAVKLAQRWLMCSLLLLQSYRNIGTPLSELQHDKSHGTRLQRATTGV
uniref:Uncharacterized protein n=1 Tax=Escherichia coli TaxID=562 RepID=A0A3G1QC66_ECOLX|nr:hypothetical protein [Escherichia coli]